MAFGFGNFRTISGSCKPFALGLRTTILPENYTLNILYSLMAGARRRHGLADIGALTTSSTFADTAEFARSDGAALKRRLNSFACVRRRSGLRNFVCGRVAEIRCFLPSASVLVLPAPVGMADRRGRRALGSGTVRHRVKNRPKMGLRQAELVRKSLLSPRNAYKSL